MAPTPGQKTIFLHELYRRQTTAPDRLRVVDVVAPQGQVFGLPSVASSWSGAGQGIKTSLRQSGHALGQYLQVAWQHLKEWCERWQWQRKVSGYRRSVPEMVAVFAAALLISYLGVNYQALLARTSYWLDSTQRQAQAAQLEQRIAQDEVQLSYIPRSTKLAAVAIPVAPSDDRLIVPRLGINVPIVDSLSLENKDVMRDLEEGVVHLASTAYPGQVGNVFLTGHSSYYPWATGDYKTVFALLDKLEPGDKIALYWQGEKYIYQVAGQRVVAADDVSVVAQRSDQRKLTLMTCYPVGTNSHRLIIDAYQTGGSAQSQAA